MPELPEVETVVTGLKPLILNSRISEVVLNRPDLRIPFPQNFAAQMEGADIVSLNRRAKYILATLSNGNVWITHLGMSGRLIYHPAGLPAPQIHDHVNIRLDNGGVLVYNDPRRFGLMTVAESRRIGGHAFFRHLGPEPLSDDFTGAYLFQALTGKKQSIKPALMNQELVVGVGNIYACEALYYAGIDPVRAAGSLSHEECAILTRCIKSVLEDAITGRGSSLRDYRQGSGEKGGFQNMLRVYGREGRPCDACGKDECRIVRIQQAGRSTFFCPSKQR